MDASTDKIVTRAVSAVDSVLLGKRRQVQLALACLFARGHLLIEDLPGMGKTTLAHALAKVLGLSYNRIQFTSDLLPADVTGAAIFDKEKQKFVFRPGPVFAQVLLADEINRATPRTQSALLEAMEERQVTVEGNSYPLPEPFFVIATQNPGSQMGTYPLPESQLDRFLMRIELGYPDPKIERALLMGDDPRLTLAKLEPVVTPAQLLAIQQQVNAVHASDTLLDYLQRIVRYTREQGECPMPLSPRGAMSLLRAARAFAFVQGRAHVVPEDVQAVAPCVLEHRLRGAIGGGHSRGQSLTARVLTAVPVV
ncbi:MAG: AAA family ATPase [Gammaproteobacteria bacterium]